MANIRNQFVCLVRPLNLGRRLGTYAINCVFAVATASTAAAAAAATIETATNRCMDKRSIGT